MALAEPGALSNAVAGGVLEECPVGMLFSSSSVRLSQTALLREQESVPVCAEGGPGRPGVHQPVKCA